MNEREQMPVGILMIEHRLIERMIRIMENEIEKMQNTRRADAGFIDTAVDFIRTYADKGHHGKEENILFRDLDKKDLSLEHRKTVEDLIAEHIYARNTVAQLVEAKEKYTGGDEASIRDIILIMKQLVEFYPKHIEKEDKHFFIPCMDYFSQDERDAMVREFRDFDNELIQQKYKKIVEDLEK